MKYKLVALDLDGTSLNNKHELSERSIFQFRELSRRGILVCIATGRSLNGVVSLLSVLNLPQEFVPVVCYNGALGALCRKLESGEYQKEVAFHNPLNGEHVDQILDFCHQKNCVAQYYNALSGEVFAAPRNDSHIDLLKRYEKLVGHPQTILPNYDQAKQQSLSAKLLIMTDSPDQIIAEVKTSLPNAEQEFTIIRGSPFPFFVEILRKNVTKGQGLELLCSTLGIGMEEVIAFGDGENDCEMLSLVGLGVAPANAKEEAKKCANRVLQFTNDEDAVARELEEMMTTNSEWFLV
jgi:Cof subfamily protein (haloacid dehalogenase superfamily)